MLRSWEQESLHQTALVERRWNPVKPLKLGDSANNTSRRHRLIQLRPAISKTRGGDLSSPSSMATLSFVHRLRSLELQHCCVILCADPLTFDYFCQCQQ